MRITGYDAERLSIAARHAADAGLEVWFSPFPADLAPEQILALFADCAARRGRAAGAFHAMSAGHRRPN